MEHTPSESEKQSEIQKMVMDYLQGKVSSSRDFQEKTGISHASFGRWRDLDVSMGLDKLEQIWATFPELRVMIGEHLTGNKMENITPVQNGSDNKENSLGVYKEVYEKFLGTASDYLFMHRDVLKSHRLVAVEQLEKEKQQAENAQREIAERMKQIEKLTDLIGVVATRPISIQLTDSKKTQKDT